MSSTSAAGSIAAPRPRPFAAVFWGGLLAGIFDITQAFVGFGLLGAKPFRILQHIAGGVFGALDADGVDVRRVGPDLSLHHRVHCRGSLLRRKP